MKVRSSAEKIQNAETLNVTELQQLKLNNFFLNYIAQCLVH